ncbi:MAG: hypothetical protein IOD12_13955, partial [Silvanigrellales bacterium]|nr:hypothetical protein [Silvanigrellales bacterium]
MNSPRFAPFFSVLLLVLPQTLEFHLGFAQGPTAAGSSVPRAQLPPTVQAALKSFENQFELTLAQDCPAERCFSRGCTYVSHETVDRARNASLPGLGEPEAAPGAAGPAQEYLTAARCEFAYENTLPAKDIATLVKRLEQKLARGYTTLSVEAKPLPALPATLRQTPAPPANSPEVNATPGVLATPDGLSQALAMGPADVNPNWLRELWKALLPHVSWMIAILLGTTALLILIWAFRRLGRQSPEELAEEKALLAALDEEGASGESSPKEPASEKPDADKESSDEEHAATEGALDERKGLGSSQAGLDDAHAKLHRGPSSDAILKAYGTPGVWKARMQSEPGVFEGVVRRWLREKDFGSIAKLALGSQEEFRRVLPSGEEFA